MIEILNKIRGTQDFEAIFLLSPRGEVIYRDSLSPLPPYVEDEGLWRGLAAQLHNIVEAELVFSNKRLYVKQSPTWHLVVVTGLFAPMAKVRMYCDIVLSSLKDQKRDKVLISLLGRKK